MRKDQNGMEINQPILEHIVDTNPKKRFAFILKLLSDPVKPIIQAIQ